ncbi:ScbA/BarX family gamma-butyrolactone biosynthesis protein [Streptomyces sp. NPDC060322]|uniref:ScbA/BarX family gamma-butyrolactone biosynthesis protein n=1 Tax=Streptomyces sp. NPDC060322 TaxID=3347097 RepID=UPI003660277D
MNFDRCVPRHSVHKTADTEVLLTDAEQLSEERFAVAALWHRDHYLAHQGGPAADPVLLMETVRQTAIHLSHRFLNVAHGMSFVLNDISVDLFEALPPVGPGAPLTVGLDVICRRPAADARRLRLELDAVVLVRDRSIGRLQMCWEPMEPRRYALLRQRGGQDSAAATAETDPAHALLAPDHVGQVAERDVLIASDPLQTNSWSLRLDRGHPVLFDHESDHVPGMALVEAFRQAGRVASAAGRTQASSVTLLAVTFKAFGELDAPVSITADPAGGEIFNLRALQNGRELARGRVRCSAAERTRTRMGTAC